MQANPKPSYMTFGLLCLAQTWLAIEIADEQPYSDTNELHQLMLMLIVQRLAIPQQQT